MTISLARESTNWLLSLRHGRLEGGKLNIGAGFGVRYIGDDE